MQKTEMNFERVPVELVRKIAALDGPQEETCEGKAGDNGKGPLFSEENPERTWDGKPRRPWQELARAISAESDPVKIGELCKQLDAALSEEERRRGRGIPGKLSPADGNKRIAS